MRGLRDKRVLISGGSSGIGLATGQRFVEEGSRVFLTGLDGREVDSAVAGLRRSGEATGVACDVSLEGDVARMVESAHRALGGIDVLINNAGTARRDPFLSIAAGDWDRIIAVNLRGMFLVAQAVSRHMVAHGGGVVINMSSTNGLAAEEDYAHYNASKGGVLLLTKTMAVELGSHGIRVNALCPGPVATPLLMELFAKDPERAARRLVHIPMGRFAEPEEIASTVAFLASDDASFITASTFLVDGGLTGAYVTPL